MRIEELQNQVIDEIVAGLKSNRSPGENGKTAEILKGEGSSIAL